jgi:DNA-binding protein HU-beta
VVRIEVRKQVAAPENAQRSLKMPPAKKPAVATAKRGRRPGQSCPRRKNGCPGQSCPRREEGRARRKEGGSRTPAKKAVAAKAAPQVTITLKQIAAQLAEGHDLPKKVAEGMLGDFVTLATQHLTKGDKIRLTGLGILQVRSREARMGRNPATGESIQIAAGKKIAFRPAKELKEAV